MSKKWVYFFGNEQAEGDASMRMLLGGKGANLHEMSRLGVPVPPGFTITTQVCSYYFTSKGQYPDGLEDQVAQAMKKLEGAKGQRFGDPDDPLLVSVRSGAPVSMPGMMDTILNLGLNDDTVQGLIKSTQDKRFAYDAYRRFVQMFSNVVTGVPGEEFENLIEQRKKQRGVEQDTQLSWEDWKDLVKEFKALYKKHNNEDFPEQPQQQLWMAINAVFSSWNNDRAIAYRKINRIPDDWGTAVNVVAMVFGNMGEDSGTGVLFTRNPSTGEKRIYGEFLINAQGEDVVAGIRTPSPLDRATALAEGSDPDKTLEALMPDVYKQLLEIAQRMEQHYRDMQDMEFTVERGKLWLLQTRNGKRTPAAAVKIAHDLVKEGLIDTATAITRVEPEAIEKLLHPTVDPKYPGAALAVGIPASPGAATGQVVFQPDEAEKLAAKGVDVILVRTETSPEDIKGMNAAKGILTSRGGKTSHAAVVARGMGKPAVVGAEDITVDYKAQEFRVKDLVVSKGEEITIDGISGKVYKGNVPKIQPEIGQELARLLSWADEHRKLGVRANADTPKDAAKAREFGAQGIGLARTEHMFFEGERIWHFREMILVAPEAQAGDQKAKQRFESALRAIKSMQKQDFKGILEAMDGLPVIIRLLDPPLHEFLPHEDEAINELAGRTGMDKNLIISRSEALAEANPMLGHRGVRLAITFPQIYIMQAEAIAEATQELLDQGKNPQPKIMIPLVGFDKELEIVRAQVAQAVASKTKAHIPIGTMMEVPRACLIADKVAQHADFFSFGTNDLTQMTLGFSRDDAGKFIPDYIEQGIFQESPFSSLDQEGVGLLVEMAAQKGKQTKPDLEVGICGEHGGDPESIYFCHRAGLDYVSCSPFRVPVARLAAARVAVLEKQHKAKVKER